MLPPSRIDVLGFWVRGAMMLWLWLSSIPFLVESAMPISARQSFALSRHYSKNNSVLTRNTLMAFPNEMATSTPMLVLLLRGGDRGDDEDDEILLESSRSDSPIIMDKLRNIIRSVLKLSDKKAPVVSSTLRSLLSTVENIFGISLLPPKKKSKKKKQDKKSRKSKSKAVNKKESEDETTSIETEAEKKSTPPHKPDAMTMQHLKTRLTSKNPNYRIQKELKEFVEDPPPNLSVKVGKNIRIWIVTMMGAENTIYEGEVYKLRIAFPPSYPTMPPSVYFLPPNIPYVGLCCIVLTACVFSHVFFFAFLK